MYFELYPIDFIVLYYCGKIKPDLSFSLLEKAGIRIPRR